MDADETCVKNHNQLVEVNDWYSAWGAYHDVQHALGGQSLVDRALAPGVSALKLVSSGEVNRSLSGRNWGKGRESEALAVGERRWGPLKADSVAPLVYWPRR